MRMGSTGRRGSLSRARMVCGERNSSEHYTPRSLVPFLSYLYRVSARLPDETDEQIKAVQAWLWANGSVP